MKLDPLKLRVFVTRPGGGAEQFMQRTGYDIVARAKQKASASGTPVVAGGDINVQSGRFRASIDHQVTREGADNLVLHVGSNVEYFKYLHFGTSRMAARPILTQAAREAFGR